MNDNRSDAEKAAIRAEVERVRLEHHDLEAAIEALLTVGAVDQLQIQRLKKRKLLLRNRVPASRGRNHPGHNRLNFAAACFKSHK